MALRVLIADDEPLVRAQLRRLLGDQGVEVVSECADGESVLRDVVQHRPDALLLDIQMPRLDGFGVIQEVGVEAMPLTVFVTAYDEHALRAFEVHALDYLLKPFAPSRFTRLLERVRRQLAPAPPNPSAAPGGDLAQRIERLLATVRPEPGHLRQLLVEPAADPSGRQRLLAVETIDRIEAEGNYLLLTTAQGTFRRRGTLSEFESRLDPDRFLRLNRSTLLRLDVIAEVQPWFHGDARVVLKDGSVLTWSRRYRARTEGRF